MKEFRVSFDDELIERFRNGDTRVFAMVHDMDYQTYVYFTYQSYNAQSAADQENEVFLLKAELHSMLNEKIKRLPKQPISSLRQQYRSTYPFNNPSLISGFTLFRDHCMKCHAVNGIGGSMGPEFNFPKSIFIDFCIFG